MPARKTPADWRPRTIALLRKAAELGSVWRAAGEIRERRPQLIENAIQLAEATQLELIAAEGGTDPYRYNRACRVVAEQLECNHDVRR